MLIIMDILFFLVLHVSIASIEGWLSFRKDLSFHVSLSIKSQIKPANPVQKLQMVWVREGTNQV